MIESYMRGWAITYANREWIYVDSKMIVKKDRPCRKCGKPPSATGHDSCIGTVPGAFSVCCGHGAERGFILRKEK